MSKSHKKFKKFDEIEEKPHHVFKQQKNNAAKKQLRKLERAIKVKDINALYEVERYT